MSELHASPSATAEGGMTHQPAYNGRLSLLSGVQKGASAVIATGEAMSIGRSANNDVILRDPGGADGQVRLHLLDGVMRVEVLSGEVSIDGIDCSQGDERVLPELSLLQTGNVTIQVQSPDSSLPVRGKSSRSTGSSGYRIPAKGQHGVDDDAIQPDPANELSEGKADHDRASGSAPDRAFDDIGADVQSPLNANSPMLSAVIDTEAAENANAVGNLTSRLLGLATLAIVLIGVYSFSQAIILDRSSTPKLSLVEALAGSPYEHLHLDEGAQVTVLTGFVDTENDAVALNRWLASRGIHLDNRVWVSETLGTQVKEVFRVNGVKADISKIENGAVRVSTSVADKGQLTRIEAMVLADVPGVSSLTIDNIPPPVEADEQGPIDPGKRVALVVSDEPAYIVTVDQSRYFVGSILPNGQRIESIEDGKVSTSKNGELSTLEF